MPTITNSSDGAYKDTSRRQYIASAAFNTYFFSYTAAKDVYGNVTGTIATVTGATSVNCPAARILRETGRKLYPGVNPGVTVYMVGVYDDQSLLTGFIDPNAPVFAVFSTDRPNFLENTIDAVGGLKDAGPSVITNGPISGISLNVSTINAVNSIFAGSTITAGFNVTASTITALSSMTAGTSITASTIRAISSITSGTNITAGTYLNAPTASAMTLFDTGLTLPLIPYTTTNTSADTFIVPTLGNIFTLTLPASSLGSTGGVVNIYLRNPAAPGTPLTVIPQGQQIILIVTNNAGRTVPIRSTGGVVGVDINVTNGNRAVITWTSVGTVAYQTSSSASY
jgi:hypothetical protein